ncbi:MAG: tetratricopeptide repeat protein [Planctomycetota bacterium]
MSETQELSVLFSRALKIHELTERQAFIREHCGDDQQLADDLLQMLRVHQKASGFLSTPPRNVSLPAATRVGRDSVMGRLTQEFDIHPALPHGDDADSPTVSASAIAPRYQLHGEIARGGMGAIVKARDVDLGRTLAIKVLLDEHGDNPAIAERFIEEAQIGGQLQHPGIAPVYELGQMPDDRPFFSMKLVKGDTLAALLADRKDTKSDRQKQLGVFEQICQTMAYAHSRRVIHRDLKPANIMVGNFGEVQVMDWGLAKVMKVGGIADEQRARSSNLGQSLIQTVRSGSNSPQALVGTKRGAGSASSDTQAGSVMGTPAYMPPEQALGEVERLDERCDVFGLGAILCEILTGQPPYVSDDSHDLFRQAAHGKLDECFERLDKCGADEALCEIARGCLQPEIEDRIRTARELSTQVNEYLESVEQRLRETEVERAAEATRAIEETKRRRVTTALAGSAILVCVLCGAGWIWMQLQATQLDEAKVAQLNEQINNARLHQGLADVENVQKRLSELEKAMQYAQRGLELAKENELGEDRRAKIESLLTQLKDETKTVEKLVAQQSNDKRLADRLELIRMRQVDPGWKPGETDETSSGSETSNAYSEAFQDAGMEIDASDSEQIARGIRESQISEPLIAGLDHWAASLPETSSVSQLVADLRMVGDWKAAIAVTRQYIEKRPEVTLPYIDLVGMLAASGDRRGFEQVRDQLLRTHRFPESHSDVGRLLKAVLLFPLEKSAATAINDLSPQSLQIALDQERVSSKRIEAFQWNTMALLKLRRGEMESCLKDVSKSEAADLSGSVVMLNLVVRCMAEASLGNEEAATKILRELDRQLSLGKTDRTLRRSRDSLYALVLRAEAERLVGGNVEPWAFQRWTEHDVAEEEDKERIQSFRLKRKLLAIANLADGNDWRRSVRSALHAGDTGTLAELASSEDIIAQRPELTAWLATELRGVDKPELALGVLRRVYKKHPSDFWINRELTKCSNHLGRSTEALGYARAALAVRPKNFSAKRALCLTLELVGQQEESDKLFSQILADNRFETADYRAMAKSLSSSVHLDKAKKLVESWISEAPDDDEAMDQMSYILYKQDRIAESVDWAERSIAINENNSSAWFRKAWGHSKLEQLDEAESAYRQYLELKPDSGTVHNNLGSVVKKLGRLDEAADLYRKAMKLDPSNRYAANNLRRLLTSKEKGDKRGAAVAEELRQLSIRIAKDDRTAIEEFQKQVRSNPLDVEARLDLARRLVKVRDYDSALSEAERALKIAPNDPKPHAVLFTIHIMRRETERAIASGRKAIELGSDETPLRFQLGQQLVNQALGRIVVPFNLSNEDSKLIDNATKQALLNEAINLALPLAESSDEPNGKSPITRPMAAMLERWLRLAGRSEEADDVAERFPRPAARSQQNPDGELSAVQGRVWVNLQKEIDEAISAGGDAKVIQMLKDKIATADGNSREGGYARLMLAELYVEQSRDQDAIELWKKIIGQGGVTAIDGVVRLTQYHRTAGRYEQAIETLEDHLFTVGTESRLHLPIRFLMSQIYADQEDHDKEIESLQSIPDPLRNPVINRHIASRIFDVAGNAQQAINELNKLTRPLPTIVDLEVLFLIADPAEVKEGSRMQQATALLGQILDQPMQRFDLTGRSSVKRLPPTVSLVREMMSVGMTGVYRSSPNSKYSFSAKNTEGILHYRRGDFGRALKALNEFRDLGFEEPSNWLFLAMTHWQLGDQEEARQWHVKAIDFLERDEYEPSRLERMFRQEAGALIEEETK